MIQWWEAARLGDAGKRANGGRPRGTGDLLPREEIRLRAAIRALAARRADAVAALLDADPDTTAADVSAQLGYPTRTARTALTAARSRSGARER
ncbi:hypothetical protein ACIO3O_41835 [Streptomyces sp. NPDC087440]|uniref:hypothetical protein n=1 Tax=Streptomyces sp. NPDC087440 TaxID=3365790 RepID=UPI00381938E2